MEAEPRLKFRPDETNRFLTSAFLNYARPFPFLYGGLELEGFKLCWGSQRAPLTLAVERRAQGFFRSHTTITFTFTCEPASIYPRERLNMAGYAEFYSDQN